MPTDDLRQIGPSVDADLWAEFRDFVHERNGGIKNYLRQELEHALRNHMELSETGEGELHAKLLRQEMGEFRDEILSRLDGVEKEKTNRGQTVTERAEQIDAQLQADFGAGPVSETALKTVITDVAGGSRPTIRQYRDILLGDGELYENPSPKASKAFIYGDEEYVSMVHTLADSGAITQDQYEAAVDEIGEDRYAEIISDRERTDPGFA